MNDHEINRRLAQISAGGDPIKRRKLMYTLASGSWRPLTRWPQLGPLMEAHVWSIERHFANPQEWRVWAKGLDPEGSMVGYACMEHIDLKRAICLAIIAAHKEQIDE